MGVVTFAFLGITASVGEALLGGLLATVCALLVAMGLSQLGVQPLEALPTYQQYSAISSQGGNAREKLEWPGREGSGLVLGS